MPSVKTKKVSKKKNTRSKRGTSRNSNNLDTRELLDVLEAMKQGDFSVRMKSGKTGISRKIASALNDVINLNQKTSGKLEQVIQ